MELPSSQPMNAAPIPIDHISRHVRLFIDMIYSSNTAFPAIEMDDYKPLLLIAEHLQAFDIQKNLWLGFQDAILADTSTPYLVLWEFFGMAAREDDNTTCSLIILAFLERNLHYDTVLSQRPEFYIGIPSRYLAVLFTGLFRWSHKHAGEPAYKTTGWSALALRFATMKDPPSDLDLRIGDGGPTI
jgi:hypothetical protein